MMKKSVISLLPIFVLIALYAAPNCAQPIQNESAEVTESSGVNNDDETGGATVAVPIKATAAEYLVASPQWLGNDELAEQEHVRPVRHIGFGGIGGGFVGGFAGGAVASPAYSVPLVQTVPVITTVPVVSTISTYPSYATGYGYGGYAPAGFGGLGFGKFRSSYSVKGFGLGGGFIG